MTDSPTNSPVAIQVDALAGVPHGFMTCEGGVSTGLAKGLQCGFGADDDEADVMANRHLAVEAVLPSGALAAPYQTHSPDVVTVTEAWPDGPKRPEGDAVVTDKPGIVLGIVTADCAPILLADKDAGVIGAAHAGWRGAATGVIANTIAAMEALGASRASIAAAIGPCIAQASYEVGEDMRANFADADHRFFVSGKPGHWHFDLEGFVAAQLVRAGLERISCLGLDTYKDEQRFYSFRRATHRGAANYGRQLSLIGLEAP